MGEGALVDLGASSRNGVALWREAMGLVVARLSSLAQRTL